MRVRIAPSILSADFARLADALAVAEAGGADLVHVEATDHLQRCLDIVRRAGAKAGAAINPATPTLALSAAYTDLDYAVVMSVNPGWGGQPFLAPSIDKVRKLEAESRAAGRRLTIEVDGGVTSDNAGDIAAAGAEILVAGTAIYGADDPAAAIGRLRDAAVPTVRT
jgi:ribulose-phosphate 3-epimerase